MSDRLSETTSQLIEVIVSKWPQCNGHKLPALRSGDISFAALMEVETVGG